MNGPVHRCIGVSSALAVSLALSLNSGNLIGANVYGHTVYPWLGALVAGTAANLPDYVWGMQH